VHKHSILTNSRDVSKIDNQDVLCAFLLLLKESMYFLGRIAKTYKGAIDICIGVSSSVTLQCIYEGSVCNTTVRIA
jgi:hypothetical protein